MKFWFLRGRGLRLWFSSGVALTIGGCGLNDLQLQSVLQSVLSSGLTTIFVQVARGLLGTTGTGA